MGFGCYLVWCDLCLGDCCFYLVCFWFACCSLWCWMIAGLAGWVWGDVAIAFCCVNSVDLILYLSLNLKYVVLADLLCIVLWLLVVVWLFGCLVVCIIVFGAFAFRFGYYWLVSRLFVVVLLADFLFGWLFLCGWFVFSVDFGNVLLWF